MRYALVPAATMGMALLLAGCATTTSDGRPQAIDGESITYETSPCYGTCPVYAVTVSPDGTGTFEGRNFTTVKGTRTFTVSPAQYRAFAAALAPYRPTQGEQRYENGSPLCGPAMVSDMQSVDVRWSAPSGEAQRIHFYYGCDRNDGGAMRKAIDAAPAALPIAEYIGSR